MTSSIMNKGPRHLAGFTRAASSSAAPPPASRDASRPYARARHELPPIQSSSNRLLALFGIVGGTLASWALFTAHATNRERLGSSVLRAALDRVREDGDVREKLGASRDPDGEGSVKLERSAWLFGDAWIGGSVNMMQGRVDLTFDIVGPKDSATVQFTSTRREPHAPFEVLRFNVTVKGTGEVISLVENNKTRTHSADGVLGV